MHNFLMRGKNVLLDSVVKWYNRSFLVKAISKVFAGNFFAQFLGFLITIYVSRDLGPENFGAYSLFLSLYFIISQIADFGLSTSYIKYGSDIYEKNNDNYNKLFCSVFWFRIIISIIIILITCIFSDFISYYIFQSAVYNKLIIATAISVILSSVYNHIVAHYTVLRKFNKYFIYNVINQFIKLVGVLYISIFVPQNISLEYYVYNYFYSIGIVILLLALVKRPRLNISGFKEQLTYLKKTFEMGFWVLLSSLATVVILRLDMFMLQMLSSMEDVGYYSLGMQLARVFPLLSSSVTTTLLPQLNEYIGKNSLRKYVLKVFSCVKYLVVIILLVEVTAPFFIQLVFGAKYHNSITVFQILIIAYSIGLIINPISMIFYHFKKVKLLTVMNWLELPIAFLGNLYFIPLYGANGAAISYTIVSAFAAIFLLFFVDKEIKRNDAMLSKLKGMVTND